MIEGITLPKLLQEAMEKFGEDRVAQRRKDFGIWQEYTWKEYWEKVKFFALGLMSLGFKRGDKLAIIGDNDPEYYWAQFAAQAAGGATIPIYTDAMYSEIIYIIDHSDSTVVVGRDQEQVDKVLKVQEDGELPKVKTIIYWDAKGLWNYDVPGLHNFDDVLQLGQKYEKEHPGVFEESVEKLKEGDLAFIMYTSGTTGSPKGAMLSHKNLIFDSACFAGVQGWTQKDEYLSNMSPAWITEQLIGVGGSLLSGMTVNFPEEPETIEEDTREIGPSVIFYGARLWESVASTIQMKISDSSGIKKFFYYRCLPIGVKVHDAALQRKEVNFFWKALYKLSWLIMFRPLLDKLGLLNVKHCYTAGALLSPESFRFIHALGLNLKQAYGTTECGMALGHTKLIKHQTIGEPFPGVEMELSKKDGEILVKSPGVFLGYYKNEEASKACMEGGKFHTGDAAVFDEDRQVVFMDRAKELLDLPDGTKFSPQFIESTLRFSPYVRDAMCLGGKDKPFVSVIMIIDYANAGKWAEGHRITYTTFTDLSQKSQIYDLIQKDVERVNKLLPEAAKIRRFLNLHKEFDPDESELTRTRKLRRGFMEQRYKRLVDAIYSDKKDIQMGAQVKYRDGRTGVITTDINIRFMNTEEDK